MITFLFLLIILGCVLYLVEHFIPMAEPIRIVIRVVVVLILIWYLLRLLGVVPPGPPLR